MKTPSKIEASATVTHSPTHLQASGDKHEHVYVCHVRHVCQGPDDVVVQLKV